MDLGPFWGFLAATIVGLGLAVTSWAFARKAGLGSVQTSLITTLQDTSDALAQQVALLKAEVDRERTLRTQLEEQVSRLKAAVADLAYENAELRRRVGLPKATER